MAALAGVTLSAASAPAPSSGSRNPTTPPPHYVFDLWIQRWSRTQARGEVIVVRYADDFIVGFEHESDAERLLVELVERFRQFALELHPDKTRRIEFGRTAAWKRARRGQGKPETFDFLGVTHICGKTRSGRFTVLRQTIRKRLQAKLKQVKIELRRRLHDPVPEVGRWLRSVVGGHSGSWRRRRWAAGSTWQRGGGRGPDPPRRPPEPRSYGTGE